LNAREKFLASMAFERDAPILKMEYGYWAGTVRRWYGEGLHPEAPVPPSMVAGESVRAEVMGFKPGGFVDRDIHRLFALDDWLRRIPLNNYMYPVFEEEILEDHGAWRIYRDEWGIVRRESKGRDTPTALVRGPVGSIEDWMAIRDERLQPSLHGRLPQDWDRQRADSVKRDFALILGGGQGFYGTPRYLIGDQQLLVTFYDNPKLIHAINDHLCRFWIALYDAVLDETSVDIALIWEDMCYKNGPLISPAMFEEFLLPYYKRLCGFFKDHGIEVILVDTDGDARKLIPLFVEGGVTGMFPLEVSAGMDLGELRSSFPRFQLIGGIDKRALSKDLRAVDAELARVEAVLDSGGLIPCVDHLVPPDVSWATFQYYRNHLNELIDRMNTAP
jgi:hypothetical protein